MTTQSYPFEGQDTNEDQYSKLMRNFRESGAISDYAGSGLKVTAGAEGMQVKVSTGFGVVRGHGVWCTEAEVVTIPDANAYDRIDAIVARLDPATDAITFECVQGDASGTMPPLTQTDVDVYEELLAKVSVKNGVTGIVAADVTDARTFYQPSGLVYNTANRPATGRPGQTGFNAETGYLEIADATGKWQAISIGDTGWINLTPTTGSGSYRVRNRGGVVELDCNISGFTVASGDSVIVSDVGGLPDNCRPGVAYWQTAGRWSGPSAAVNPAAQILIGNGGDLSANNRTGGACNGLQFRVTYLQG